MRCHTCPQQQESIGNALAAAACWQGRGLMQGTHLHAFWLHLLHHHTNIDLGGVLHVLLRLNVNLFNQTTGIDVVDGILPVINVVVFPFLRATEQTAQTVSRSTSCVSQLGE